MNLFCEHKSRSAEHDVGSSFTVSHASGSLCCLEDKLDYVPVSTWTYVFSNWHTFFWQAGFLDLVAAVTKQQSVYV